MSLHLNDFVSSIGTPAKTFIWSIAVPRLTVTQFRAQTAQFPSVTSTDIDLYFQGQLAKFPGAVEYEHTWTLQVVESENDPVYEALYEWRQEIFDQRTGLQGDPRTIKEDIVVKALRSTDGTPWLTGILHGAYPKQIDAIELDRANNTEPWRWNMTFSFDWWEKV